MKAKVIGLHKKPTKIDGVEVKLGDVVEVNSPTFINLRKAKVLEAADAESKKIADDEVAVLTESDAEKQIEAANEAREAKKAADEAKKKAQNK